jgi:ABC-type branched-subunit amino acid transport system substrate-binding protein
VTDLRAAGSRAVLIGTGCATGGSGAVGLAGVPAVAATVTDLATTLVDRCGMTAGNVRVVLDPALPFGVGEALAEETRRAEDALLIYFCGHGLVSLDGTLYLATAATDSRPGYLTHTAVAYAQVRDAVLESPARVKIVILDCCYSGRAFATLGDTAGPEATGLSRIHGGYVLTAAGANEAALAPPGEQHTAFGGALIRLLTEGDPDGPQELTLQHVYAHLREMLPARGFPRPRRLATEAADGFVLAINPAFRLTDADLGTEPAGTGGEDSCPYRGLAAFDTGDSAWFFGRADETRTTPETVQGVRVLGGKGLPVVAALVTADDFDEEPLNLLRVRPPNVQLAAVIARYIRDKDLKGRAVVVGDTNSGNLYAQSLRADILNEIRPHVARMNSISYVGSHGATPTQFGVVANQICDTDTQLAFFAGNQEDLAGFLDAVAARRCGPIQVFAPEPGDVLVDRARRSRLAASGVAVTAFVPAGWAAPSGPAPENPARYQQYRDDFAKAGFDPAGAATGEAVSTHDALMTLVTAVYAARSAGLVNPAAVTAQLNNLHGPLSVPGAEEDLDFGPHGVPARKAVGIVRYADGKPPQTIDVAHTE